LNFKNILFQITIFIVGFVFLLMIELLVFAIAEFLGIDPVTSGLKGAMCVVFFLVGMQLADLCEEVCR